jgi:cytochrome c-type biogenesis protein CcmH
MRGIPGPNAQDLSAAAAIPPSEQREMAEGMVGRLEARLRDQPANVDGWVMLMRSRMTLGEPDKAHAALNAAIAANPLAEAQLRQQAAVLGVR